MQTLNIASYKFVAPDCLPGLQAVQAINWQPEKFTCFPQALLDHADELADKTAATFCTSKIRCEKAALFMRDASIDPVFYLDGGILSYLDACGPAYFDGECFVFDTRRGVDAALRPRADIGASSDNAAKQTVECLPT